MFTTDFMFSKRQQRMLAALLLHPDRWYGTNELVAIGGTGTGAGRRVIEGFERSGVVRRTPRGNQVLYGINPDSPIFAELRSICMKTFGLADVVREELAAYRSRIVLAFIFGSVATGRERATSDIDLMVVADLDVFELGISIERMQQTLGRVVDLNLYSASEWERLADDRVIAAIMKGPKIVVWDAAEGS